MKKLISTLLFLFVIAIMSLSAQTRVYAPSLTAPEDGDDGQMPDVILNWEAVAGTGGIVLYETQLDITDAFTNPVVFPYSEFTGIHTEDLLFGQEYFWRVRAKEGSDVSDWSETFSFTVFVTIDMNKPSNGADEQEINVDLKAKDRIGSALITGVDRYEFEADTSASFDSPILFHKFSPTSVAATSNLRFGAIYNWRARATHTADNSAWSEVWTFETIANVTLKKPNNGDVNTGLGVELTWDKLDGIIDYEVQIAKNDAFSNAYSIFTEELKYTTTNLIFGTEYFWRVRANHLTDTSAWSEVRTFETIGAVILNLPANGDVVYTTLPKLDWKKIIGIESYQVQYNDLNNFDDPMGDYMVIGDNNFFQIYSALEKGSEYFWRCRSMILVDTSDWSSPWSFTVAADIGINETGFDDKNISIYPNPSNGKLYIDIAASDNTEVKISVMDLLGQIHVDEVAVFGSGNNTSKLDLNHLANGLYIVRLSNGSHSYSHKITIHK